MKMCLQTLSPRVCFQSREENRTESFLGNWCLVRFFRSDGPPGTLWALGRTGERAKQSAQS